MDARHLGEIEAPREALGVERFVVARPEGALMFRAALQAVERGDGTRVVDVADLLAESLDLAAAPAPPLR